MEANATSGPAGEAATISAIPARLDDETRKRETLVLYFGLEKTA